MTATRQIETAEETLLADMFSGRREISISSILDAIDAAYAERDKLRKELNLSNAVCEGLREQRDYADEQVKTLLAACKNIEAFWNKPPSGPGMDARAKETFNVIRETLRAAIAKVEASHAL